MDQLRIFTSTAMTTWDSEQILYQWVFHQSLDSIGDLKTVLYHPTLLRCPEVFEGLGLLNGYRQELFLLDNHWVIGSLKHVSHEGHWFGFLQWNFCFLPSESIMFYVVCPSLLRSLWNPGRRRKENWVTNVSKSSLAYPWTYNFWKTQEPIFWRFCFLVTFWKLALKPWATHV